MTTRFDLATCNYVRFSPDMGVAVRSSNGAPRWRLKYPLTLTAPETFPPRKIMRLEDETRFRDLYRSHLDDAGLDVIASRFRALSVAAGDPRLVLLCFEKLETGSFCHRRLFAEWWEDRTGEVVAEHGPTGPPPPEPDLFG